MLSFIHYMQRNTMKTNSVSTFDDLPAGGFIRQPALLKIVPFSPATLWRKCKTGQFPKPVKLSERVTAWRVGDVRQFLLTHSAGGTQ